MSVLSDRWIKKMALEKEMIKPFVSKVEQWNRWIDKWEIVSEETVPS